MSKTDLERLQQVLRTTNNLLPQILSQDVLTAFENVQSLENGIRFTFQFVYVVQNSKPWNDDNMESDKYG